MWYQSSIEPVSPESISAVRLIKFLAVAKLATNRKALNGEAEPHLMPFVFPKEKGRSGGEATTARNGVKFMGQGNYSEYEAFLKAISSPKGIAKVSEAVTAILTALNFPLKRRGLVLALIGLSRGEEEFTACHLELGKRLYPFDESLEGEEKEKREKAISNQVKRELGKLTEVQTKTGITLVSYSEGGKIDTVSFPSKYKLPILPLIAETLTKFSELRRTKTKDAMTKAARIVAEPARATMTLPPKTRQVTTIPKPDRYFKQSLSLADKFAEEFGDKYTAYDQLFEEIKKRRDKAREVRKSDDMPLEKNLNLNDLQKFKGVSRATENEPEKWPESFEFQVDSLTSESQKKGGQNSISVIEEETVNSENFPSLPSDMPEEFKALAVFSSVGLEPSKGLWIKDRLGKKALHRRDIDLCLEDFEANLPAFLEEAKAKTLSFCVRWQGPFIQVDDCDALTVFKLRPFAFAVIQTSPGNYQAWLALAGSPSKPEVEAIRNRLLKALEKTGANGGAYGSVRWPGSFNFKPGRKTELGGFPLVQLSFSKPGRKTTAEELEGAGLLAEAETPAPLPPSVTHSSFNMPSDNTWWPDYEQCLREAPLVTSGARKGLPDRSRADAKFVSKSLKAGHSESEVEAMLRIVSERAKEEATSNYVPRTVTRAAAFIGV